MAVLFFRLRGVPDDEVEDVRELLEANDIEFYETSAGSWGISMPAIWLYREEDLEKIQPLFDHYQRRRSIEQRNLYLQAKLTRQTRHISFSHTLKLFGYGGIMIFIIYISFKWLFDLGMMNGGH